MTDSTESAIRKAEAASYAQTLREDRHYSRDQIMLSLASFLDKCAAGEPQPSHVNRPFWLVWNEQASAPKKKHATEPEAIAEAERLAELHKCRIVVLKSICEFNPAGVQRTDHAIK